MFEWDAELYGRFEKERTIPSHDLVNAIETNNAKLIIDIGCGIGNSTSVLKNKYPEAKIIGADSSEDMLISAKKNYPELEFIKLDAETELHTVKNKYDIIFSNACIHWVSEHKILLKNLYNLLNYNGTLAIQIPQQKKHAMHKIITKVVESDKWKNKFLKKKIFHSLSEEEYYDVLSNLTNNFRIWETIYFHTMPSHQSIIEWYKGAGLRPYLEQLSDEDKIEFEIDILNEVKNNYNVQANGNIIFKFPRLFMIAKKELPK